MKWLFVAFGAIVLWLGAIARWLGAGPFEDPTDIGDVATVLGAAILPTSLRRFLPRALIMRLNSTIRGE